MTDQPEPAPVTMTDDELLRLGVWLLVGGLFIYLLSSSMLDFLSFGSKEPVSYKDLADRTFMTYVWLGLMMGGALRYKNLGDKTSRQAIWSYRAAVWLGTLFSVTFAINLLGWWFRPETALKYFLAATARQDGMNVHAGHLEGMDFKPVADSITYHWLGGIVMLVSLIALGLGILMIREYRKDHLAALAESTS